MFSFGVTLRHQLQSKIINQENRNANSKTKHSTRNIKTPTPSKTINQEHKDANSKTKHSTRNIKMANPKQINQLGT
jgi:hypothetical protein